MPERHGFQNSNDAKAETISHSGTVMSRGATELLLRQDTAEEPEPAPKPEKPRPAWKLKVQRIIQENYFVIALMSIVTFYVLFMDDIRMLTMPKSADLAIDITIIIALCLYLAELIASILVVEGYFLSFYFWVDLLSFVSLIPDLNFVMDGLERDKGASDGADIAKTSRATRVIRIIRIIRLVRLLRIVKIY